MLMDGRRMRKGRTSTMEKLYFGELGGGLLQSSSKARNFVATQVWSCLYFYQISPIRIFGRVERNNVYSRINPPSTFHLTRNRNYKGVTISYSMLVDYLSLPNSTTTSSLLQGIVVVI